MSLEDPATAAPVTPARRRTISVDLSQLPSAGTAIGVGLLSAAVLVAVLHSRNDFDIAAQGGSGDIDVAVFLVGVVAVLVLFGIAVAGLALDRITEATVVSWPGAAGSAGAGALVAVLVNEGPEELYAGAGTALTLALVGLAIAKAAPFVVTALSALTLLYVQGFDDVVGFSDSNGETSVITVGAAISVFVIVVSVAGWFLRETPAVTAVLAGIGGLVAMVVLLQLLVFTGMLSAAFSEVGATPPDEFSSGSGFDEDYLCGMEAEEGALDQGELEDCYESQFDDGELGEDVDSDFRVSGSYGPSNDVKRDIYVTLGFALLLGLFWTAFGMATGHVAFRILVAADAAIMIPAATMALVVDHPAWWEIALIVLGGVVLAVASGAVRRRRAPETVDAP